MPLPQPATKTLVARNLSNLEGALNETTPSADKAYNKILATTEGMAEKQEYAYMASLVKANSILTAEDGDLDDPFGIELDTPRNQAASCEAVANFPVADGIEVPLSQVFIGPQGLSYHVKASVTAPSGSTGSGANITLICDTPGSSGQLSVGDELTLQQPISGTSERTATVSSVTVDGTEREDDEDYRVRLLDAQRAEPGGGNNADYRIYAQRVVGVKRAYPFTGRPYDLVGDDLPGERTVYIEATPSIDPDGIASPALIALVRAAILNDPDTEEARELLGLTEDTLYVQSIARTPIYTNVVGLAVRSGTLAAAQAAIETVLNSFYKKFRPYIQGLDPTFDRLDKVTSSLISQEVQAAIAQFGGTAQNVLFGTTVGVNLPEYQIQDGELISNGGVTFTAGS